MEATTFPYVPADWEWHDKAACRDADKHEQSAFTTLPPGMGTAPHVRRLAEQYCNMCPVLAECFAWAEADEGFIGVAAARVFSDSYRKQQAIRRSNARAVPAAEKNYEEWKRG